MSNAEALVHLLGTPDLCSKRWVWEQYDHLILGNSVQQPGGDAGVVRIGDGPKGLAMTTDVTQRYCEADPVEGGKQAVAEAWRNITATGALPLALTDNLNFGNPEKPEYMGQLVGCIQGIGEAARALDFPIVSGNVSLYNETQGRGILPTPSIGGVGVIADVAKSASVAFKMAGQSIVLIGVTQGWLGQSVYLRDVCGREEGAPPPVDLDAERRNGDFVRKLIEASRVDAVHDLSDGGLAVALAEMAMASRIGAKLVMDLGAAPHGVLFGEDQARYLMTASADEAAKIVTEAKAAGVPATVVGVTGGDKVELPGEAPVAIERLARAHEEWLPVYMAGPDALVSV
jgi:phosphoribosylformylglycinamidine synthase